MTNATPVLYACGAVLLAAFLPNFAKIGGKRSAPSLSATLYATVVFIVYLVTAILGKSVQSMLSMDNLTFLKLLGAGVIRAGIWLCLFAALSTGQVNRVLPLYLMTDVIQIILSLILGKSHAGIWRLCCIVLVLLGAVMTESRSRRGKNARWLWFSLLALAANIGLVFYYDRLLPSVSQDAIRLGETGLAALMLWVLSAAGKAMNSFKKMETDNWLFLILAGLAYSFAAFCETQAHAIGDVTVLEPIRCALLPLMVLFARLIGKEKMPGSAVLGVALFSIGTFGLMLNF